MQLIARLKKKGILRKREPTKERPDDSESEDEEVDEDEFARLRTVRPTRVLCPLTCVLVCF